MAGAAPGQRWLAPSELIRRYTFPTIFGIALVAIAYAISLPLLFWMMPVIAGLLLCIPIALLSSTSFPESRLLITPEQTAPPDVLVRANKLANDADHIVIGSALIDLRNDRELLKDHLANLPDDKQRTRGQIDPHLAIARAKIEDAENFEEALSFLTTRESMAVLNSFAVLQTVLAMPGASETVAS